MSETIIAMKERGIPMSAPNIQPIIDGRKTQTRRIVKGIPDNATLQTYYGAYTDGLIRSGSAPRPALAHSLRWFIPEGGDLWPCRDEDRIKCPYGQPGDRLWVREDWRIGAWNPECGEVCIDYRADNYSRREWIEVEDDPDGDIFNRLWIQSTEDAMEAGLVADADGNYRWEPGQSPCRWRRGRFMFRWASRILLEITDVRVERLQDISEVDAKAEGLKAITKDGHIVKYGIPDLDGLPGNDNHGWHWKDWDLDSRMAYRRLWQSINGGGSWDLNPWVWVIGFKRVNPDVSHP